jgi:hypothetical protein
MATRIEFICEMVKKDYLLLRKVNRYLSVNFMDSTDPKNNREIVLTNSDCKELIEQLTLIYNNGK